MLYDKYSIDGGGHQLELHGVMHHLTVSTTEPAYRHEEENAAFLDINWGKASCMLDQEDINELAEFFGRLANNG